MIAAANEAIIAAAKHDNCKFPDYELHDKCYVDDIFPRVQNYNFCRGHNSA